MTTIPAADRLDAVLSRIHERWVEDVRLILKPAMAPGAGFWDRWSTVRFLTDQFEDFYRLEATLLERLAARLPPSDLARLRQGLGEMERTRSALVGVGRRPDTGVEASRHATALLTLVRRWGAELEGAAHGLGQADLPPEGRDLLDRLATLARIGP